MPSFLTETNTAPCEKTSGGGDEYKAEKERRAKMRKMQNDKIKLEKFLESAQQEIDRLDEALADSQNSTDFALLSKLYEEKSALEEKMFEAMESLENLELM